MSSSRDATAPAAGVPVHVFLGRDGPSYGGMENHGRQLVDWLREASSGHVLGALLVRDEEGCTVELAPCGRRVGRWSDPADLAAALRARTAHGPAVVFFNTGHWIEDLVCLRAGLPDALFCARTGGNEILQAAMEDGALDHGARQRFWADTINVNIDVLVTNSAFTGQRLARMGIDPGRCILVPGGVDAAHAHRCAPAPAASGAGARTRLVWAGRFVAFKGIDVMLDALRQIDDPGIGLTLIGDGPLRGAAVEKVARLGLAGRVLLPGAMTPSDTLAAIAAADVYVALSIAEVRHVADGSYVHTETMGRSVMEALGCGLRVVASRVGGLPEIVDAAVGELVPPGDPGAAARAIVRQLALPPVPAALRSRLASRFSWSAVFGAYAAAWSRAHA